MAKYFKSVLSVVAVASLLGWGSTVHAELTWTQATAGAGWPARFWHKSTVFAGRMWITGGSSGHPEHKNDVWSSTNGSDWTLATGSANWPSRRTHACVEHDGKLWIMGGWGGGNLSDVWHSTDGASWTLATGSAGWGGREDHTAVSHAGRMWVMGGYTSGPSDDVWYSTDGISWTEATTSPGWAGRYALSSAAGADRMWVLAGVPAPNFNDVWHSTDGASWTQATAEAGWSKRGGAAAVYFDGGLWITGGADTGGSLSDVWQSADGISWTRDTAAAGWSARGSHTSVTFDEKVWVIGGYAGGPTSDVWYGEVPCEPASISVEPVGQYACLGESATFSVTATGTEPLAYQWRKDGDELVGETSPTLVIDPVEAGDLGDYDVIVSNECGNDTCSLAALALDPADTDSDGTSDCDDSCPNDPDKTLPGYCGCGIADADSDSDGTPDCNDVSRLLHFQGKLRDAAGVPAEGTADVTFRFYDAPSGGNLLFTESHGGVSLTRGLFRVLIGTETVGGVPVSALERAEVYIGMTVGGGGELSPRSRVPASGYAIKAKAAEQLAEPGTLNPAVIVDAGGNVGVGTASPTESLHVVGNILATGSITPGSSRTLKNDIAEMSAAEARAALRELTPVKFRYKADGAGDLHLGFIAEDVPDLAATAERRGVDPMDIAAINTRVLQYQQSVIQAQGEALRRYERLLADLQERMCRQEQELATLRESTSGLVP